jgi:hypothetical protein
LGEWSQEKKRSEDRFHSRIFAEARCRCVIFPSAFCQKFVTPAVRLS